MPTVECPLCGEDFDTSKAGGWCTNPDCGEYQYVEDEFGDEDDASAGSGGGADPTAGAVQECPDCGAEMDADVSFCTTCGHEFGTEPAPGDPATPEPIPENAAEVERPSTCPSCGADIATDDAFCPECGVDIEARVVPEGQASVEEALADATGDAGDAGPVPETIHLEVGDEAIEVGDDDVVGREIRTAHVEAGGDSEEAQYIHREHVRFVREEDGFYLVDKGRNTTTLNDEELEMGDRRPVHDGDRIGFSTVAEATVRFDRD